MREITKTGQIQLPVWSPDGRMVAFSVLKAGSGATPIESARILVFREGGGKSVSEWYEYECWWYCNVDGTVFCFAVYRQCRFCYVSSCDMSMLVYSHIYY